MEFQSQLVGSPAAKDQMGMSVNQTCSQQMAFCVNDFVSLNVSSAGTNSSDLAFIDSNPSVLQNGDLALSFACFGCGAGSGCQHTDILNEKFSFHFWTVLPLR